MSEPETRGVSIESWHKLSKEGISLPVTIRLQGSSMEPLIRSGQDLATIIPMDKMPVPGDVILFRRGEGDYVVHRVYQTDPEGSWLQTWGDNCLQPDAPIKPSAVLGLVVSVEKDGRQLRLDTLAQRKRGLAWLNSFVRRPLWRFGRRAHSWLRRIVRI